MIGRVLAMLVGVEAPSGLREYEILEVRYV